MRATVSGTKRARPQHAQRGMVTVVVMLFLIATVVFALSQMLNVSSGNVIDGQRQGDSTAAFFLAESGLEKAQASYAAAVGAGPVSDTTCSTGVSGTSSIGLGSFAVSASSVPGSCSGSACTGCMVQSTGVVGIARRTIVRAMDLTTRNGTYCLGTSGTCSNIGAGSPFWKLTLTNASNRDAIGFFALATPQHQNVNPACDAGSNCVLAYNVQYGNNGVNSVSLMANAVPIPVGTPPPRSYSIWQTLTKNNGSAADANAAEVGALIQGTTAPVFAGPTSSNPVTASYSSTANTTGSGNSGTTTDGTASSSSWCYGGDAMVFAYSALVAGPTAQIADNGVVFHTAGTAPQNLVLTRLAKYPTTAISGIPANFSVISEIWVALNPNLLPATAPEAPSASSFRARGVGTIGSSWSSANGASGTKISGTTLTVAPNAAGITGIISVGDTVQATGVAANTTITPGGTGTGGAGTYTVNTSQTVGPTNGLAWTTSSSVLNVTSCGFCNFAANDTLTSGTGTGIAVGRTITPVVAGNIGVGKYTLSTGAKLLASGKVFIGTADATLYLPAGGSQPKFDGSTMIAVKSGGGVLPAGTKVTADLGTTGPSNSIHVYTMSAAPATVANALDNATICAGTCAFFDHVGATPTTTYTIAQTGAATNGWASGFTCLKNVDIPPQPVTSSSAASSRWYEVVN